MEEENIPESVVVGSCLSLLELMSFECWRNNTGAYKPKKGGYVRYGRPGSADIIGILPGGRFLAVECKKPSGGRVTQLQKDFIKMINDNGGLGLIVHSSEELMEQLKAAGVTNFAHYRSEK